MPNYNNVFKIRDIAEVFNIGLEWNAESKTIELETTSEYTEK